jgi:hypothetical protein
LDALQTPVRHRRTHDTGPDGNRRLTAMTGTALLVLFAAQGMTLLALHSLITVHIFIGLLLIGPVVLKSASALYRFTRYYTGAPAYRRAGTPGLVPRVLGPVVMATSLTQLGTGVMLALTGPGRSGQWLLLHKASFVIWFGAMSIHVLIHLPQLPRLLTARGTLGAPAGRVGRWSLLALALATGVLVAMLMVHLAGPWRATLHVG